MALDGRENGDARLKERFIKVRTFTSMLTGNLSDADATAQSMLDASPAKWHLAHTSWFFETFVLCEFVPDYRPFNPNFSFLFNSYYEGKGARLARSLRGMLTRPSLNEIRAYRTFVDAAINDAFDTLSREAQERVLLGCHHEEQHQELLLADILHLFAHNPLRPAIWKTTQQHDQSMPAPMHWIEGKNGLVDIGHDGAGFAFDCEGPRHQSWLAPHALANRLITNNEWLEFIEDGGYGNAAHWLSDGWSWVCQNRVEAPLYWSRNEARQWTRQFGLDGMQPLDLGDPVRHVSYYEADAFARWVGVRLPTEAEWESAADSRNAIHGTFLDAAGAAKPMKATAAQGLQQLFGDLWEWTGSAYLPHPGFRPTPGALGEYNGKFMSGQYVLKGGSCGTPRGHVRASYRNFFYPQQRWQFTGVRLAKDM
jgi:ergothioneine biosynthesis protein EgtB